VNISEREAFAGSLLQTVKKYAWWDQEEEEKIQQRTFPFKSAQMNIS
jgi:hypothetical protein